MSKGYSRKAGRFEDLPKGLEIQWFFIYANFLTHFNFLVNGLVHKSSKDDVLRVNDLKFCFDSFSFVHLSHLLNHVVAQHSWHMIVNEQYSNWLMKTQILFRYQVQLLLNLLQHRFAISAEIRLITFNIERMKVRRKNHEIYCLIVSYDNLLKVWPNFDFGVFLDNFNRERILGLRNRKRSKELFFLVAGCFFSTNLWWRYRLTVFSSSDFSIFLNPDFCSSGYLFFKVFFWLRI